MVGEEKKFKIKVVPKPGDVKSREYPFNDHSIIGYKKPRKMSKKDFNKFIDVAAQQVLARFGVSTIVVGVENWNELRILDESTMKKHGWVKEDSVFLLRDEIDLSQFTPEQLQSLMEDYVIPKEVIADEEE